MIFVDTNVFISFLTVPVTPRDRADNERSQQLFSDIRVGDTRAAIGEVVIHEVFNVVLSRNLLQVSVGEMCDIMRSLLSWPGWVFDTGEKIIYDRALDILERDPKLEFSDAIIAARVEALNAELATFDRRLANAYSGATWP